MIKFLKKRITCNPGQTSVANSHEAKFVVNLCLHLTSNKVPPANVGIITHLPTKVLLDRWQGNKVTLSASPSSPTSREKEELECEEVKFLEMTIYL